MIEAMKRGLGDTLDRRRMIGGPQDPRLLPITEWLWHYLMDTRRRLTALHARFVAGKLPAAPRRRATARPAAERPAQNARHGGARCCVFRAGRCWGRIRPRGLRGELRELLDDPEMRALLAASPQAGRLLRPLWRKLTTEKLPEMLRLPRGRVSRSEPAWRGRNLRA